MVYSRNTLLDALRNGATQEDLANAFAKDLNEAKAIYNKEMAEKRKRDEQKRKEEMAKKERQKEQRKDAEYVLHYLQKYYPTLYSKATVDDIIQGIDTVKQFETVFREFF